MAPGRRPRTDRTARPRRRQQRLRRPAVGSPLVADQGAHHRRRRLHRLAPLRAPARRGLGGLRARRPLDRLARERRAPARPRRTSTSSSTRCCSSSVVNELVYTLRRRLPPRRRGRRAADRRAAGAHARHEPPAARRSCSSTAHRFGKRVLIASTSEVYGDHREERPLAEDDRRDLRADDAAALGVRRLEGDGRVPRARATTRSAASTASSSRLFNTVGPRQSGQYGMVDPALRRAGARRTSRSRSTATGRRRAASATSQDTIRALAGLMDARAPRARSTTSARRSGSRSSSSRERVLELTGSRSEIEYVPYDEVYGQRDRGHAPPHARRSTKIGARDRLGAERSLDDILADVVAHEREAPPWPAGSAEVEDLRARRRGDVVRAERHRHRAVARTPCCTKGYERPT